jgi:hypothetical protein
VAGLDGATAQDFDEGRIHKDSVYKALRSKRPGEKIDASPFCLSGGNC